MISGNFFPYSHDVYAYDNIRASPMKNKKYSYLCNMFFDSSRLQIYFFCTNFWDQHRIHICPLVYLHIKQIHQSIHNGNLIGLFSVWEQIEDISLAKNGHMVFSVIWPFFSQRNVLNLFSNRK